MSSAILVDCPRCLGGGCHAIGRAPLGAPPDDVEVNECLSCDGTGKVPAKRCDVCLEGVPVALEDDLAVCQFCLDAAAAADKPCPACERVVCECSALRVAS
jgi:hypothetical protein